LNAYVHMDVDWGHGPLRLIIASPRFHRWHHADTPELYGKNIANMFPFYDVMFGTYIDPGVCREPMGAIGVPENHFLKLMAYPFVEPVRMAKREWAARRGNRAKAIARATPAE
jgi:sterol desaturase/sphingolipid hydroxylase (fatty acid hydroxylase superfamily)